MKIVKKSPARSGGSMSDANSYAENARAYCSRSGRVDGSHPVVAKGSAEWSLWMEYFDHIGHPHALPGSFANAVGKLTVPARSPDEFEPGWRAGNGAPVSQTNASGSRVAGCRENERVKPAAAKRRVASMYEAAMQSIRAADLQF